MFLMRCLILLSLVLSGAARASSSEEAISYDFTLEGIKDKDLITELEKHSLLKTQKDHKIFSVLALNKRIENDKTNFKKILRAKGYYDCKIDAQQNSKDGKPVIRFIISLGEKYTLRSLKVEIIGEAPSCPIDPKKAGFSKTMPAEADKILTIFEKIRTHLTNCGFPYAAIKSHKALRDRSSHQLDIVLVIKTGQKVYFGDMKIIEAGGVPESYIQNRVPWKKGDLFSQEKVDDLRAALIKARLFSGVDINTKKENLKGQNLEIKITLKEGKARTVAVGARFSTSEGYGAKLSWTHRNITGRADRMKISGGYGQRHSIIDAEYELPDFLSPNQTFLTSVEAKRQTTQSYQAKSYGIVSTLSRPLKKNLKLNYGALYQRENITRNGVPSLINVVGFPVGVIWDSRNNILDPTQGWQLNPILTPKVGRIGPDTYLLNGTLFGSSYWALDKKKKYLLTAWSRLATLYGGRINNIPATQRLYMGGSGSLRGYKLQLAGPVDANYKAIGGKSTIEGGFEPRLKILPKWGLAVFYEAGCIGARSSFGGRKYFFHSAGFGLRYYTDFGPLRADIAFPFEKRRKPDGKSIDAPMQFYISIGQGF